MCYRHRKQPRQMEELISQHFLYEHIFLLSECIRSGDMSRAKVLCDAEKILGEYRRIKQTDNRKADIDEYMEGLLFILLKRLVGLVSIDQEISVDNFLAQAESKCSQGSSSADDYNSIDYSQNKSEGLISPHHRHQRNLPSKTRENFPKSTQDILKCWLLAHVASPYPSRVDKEILVRSTGLSEKQVEGWFVNARRRYLSRPK